MKLISFLWIVLLCIGCSPQAQDTHKNQAADSAFDWLLGDWQRSNEQAGKQTFEQWQKQSASEYRGLGFTLADQDTVFKENILLVLRGEQWYFEVRGVNESPTIFTLTKYDSLSFQCENPTNEFPKLIRYTFDDPILKAVIADSAVEVPFQFERLPND